MSRFRSIFPNVDKPIIAMAHVPPLPGTPLYDAAAGVQGLIDQVKRDTALLLEGGFDAVLFCNEGDRPYQLKAGLEASAVMTRVATECRPTTGPLASTSSGTRSARSPSRWAAARRSCARSLRGRGSPTWAPGSPTPQRCCAIDATSGATTWRSLPTSPPNSPPARAHAPRPDGEVDRRVEPRRRHLGVRPDGRQRARRSHRGGRP